MSEAALNPPLPAVPGWYGKMPNLGDFVSRRLPDSFVRRWDAWLERGLARAQAELGSDWLGRYLVAPVYRFWLAPGVLDDSAWAGVLMPSVDAVGRYFPLTIAVAAPALHAVLAADAWFDALDAAARQVLDEDYTAQNLDDALQRIAPLANAVPIDPLYEALADALLRPYADAEGPPQHTSVWWADAAPSEADFDCHDGLPPADALAVLLTAGE